ncbi:MAG: hypothetical protein E7643_04805 [Ruminococcaceae bacterium]|nr:hypothetical protein [Oscillospiraceae bacterium]
MLRVGFSRVDVTPPLGSYVSGYYQKRFAKGILDPLELNALACNDGERTVLLIIADFIGVDRVYCDVIREKISARVGIPAEHIMLSSLHQHTSVCISMDEPHTRNDLFYMESLYRKYCDVAQMAIDDMKDAVAKLSSGETAEPIAFIRKYLMKDGSIIGHPYHRRDEILKRLGEADNTVRLIRFRRVGAKDIALVNFCTHPDVIGGEYLSADWPGFVRRFVERDLEDVSCLLLNGVQGDSNHCDYLEHDEIPKGYAHSEYMGRMIADTVERLWDSGRDLEVTRVGERIGIVSLPTRTEGMEDYEACKKLLEELKNGTCKTNPSGAERGRASRISRLHDAPIFQKLPVTVMKLGEVFVVGFGGEPFTEYARALRRALPDTEIFTACCTNGDEGYLPTKEEFKMGGYEPASSPFPSDLQNHCVDMALDLIASLS